MVENESRQGSRCALGIAGTPESQLSLRDPGLEIKDEDRIPGADREQNQTAGAADAPATQL